MEQDIRWRQRLENFGKAADQLGEFLALPALNKFERQGLIQCFEYTFELAWKTARDYLDAEGFQAATPRETLQTAFRIALVEDGHAWIDMLEKRNLMAHTYDETKAAEAEALIRSIYAAALFALRSRLVAK